MLTLVIDHESQSTRSFPGCVSVSSSSNKLPEGEENQDLRIRIHGGAAKIPFMSFWFQRKFIFCPTPLLSLSVSVPHRESDGKPRRIPAFCWLQSRMFPLPQYRRKRSLACFLSKSGQVETCLWAGEVRHTDHRAELDQIWKNFWLHKQKHVAYTPHLGLGLILSGLPSS